MFQLGIDKLGYFFYTKEKDSFREFIFFRGNILNQDKMGNIIFGYGLKFSSDLILKDE